MSLVAAVLDVVGCEIAFVNSVAEDPSRELEVLCRAISSFSLAEVGTGALSNERVRLESEPIVFWPLTPFADVTLPNLADRAVGVVGSSGRETLLRLPVGRFWFLDAV